MTDGSSYIYNNAYTKPRRALPATAATAFTPPFRFVFSAPLMLMPVLELIVVVVVIPLIVTVIVIPELIPVVVIVVVIPDMAIVIVVMEPDVVEAAAMGAVIFAST